MSDLTDSIAHFLGACPDAAIVEFTIDTSCGVTYLNLWAWRLLAGHDFDSCLARARAEDDIGFLYDVLDEVKSSCFELAVAALYPRWPDELEAGDAAIRADIATALRATGATARAFFHYVDELDLQEIEPAPAA